MSILPPTSQRVQLHTKNEVNNKIQEKTQENINYYKTKSRKQIVSRIKELDKEWDIERALETNAAIIILISSLLGIITKNIWWIVFIGVISGFLLEHALQGWCPPVPIFRRIGIRSSAEIDEEKYSLKKLIE